MAESPMVGARVPQDWQQQINAIALSSGRKEAEIVREALGEYLGKTSVDWFFGFKLHLIVNDKGELLNFVLTRTYALTEN